MDLSKLLVRSPRATTGLLARDWKRSTANPTTAAPRIRAAIKCHRALVVVLGLGLLLRLGLLLGMTSTPPRVVDEQHYAELAASLLHGRGFAWSSGDLTSMRPPLYPAFVAVLWRVAGSESYTAVRAAQIVVALLTVVAVYLLALRLFDRRVAIVAAAIVCFYPSLLFAGVLILTEAAFTLVVVFLALQYATFIRQPSVARATFLGATVGAGALIRSVLWPFPVVLVPLVALSLHGSWRRRAGLVLCLLAGYLAIVAPWAVRNTVLQRTPVIVDTMGGMNLRTGNYEHTPEHRMWDGVSLTGEKSWSFGLRDKHPDAAGWTDGQKDKWAQREALAYMASEPLTTLRRSLLKLGDFWGLERELIAGIQRGLYQPPAWFAALAAVATAVAYPIVALAAAIGVFVAAPADRRTHVFVIALAAFLSAVHAVVFGHSRYHLPLVPFLAVYAAAGCSAAAWRHLLDRPRLALGAAASCAALLAFWSREVFVRDAEHIRALLQRLT